MFAVAGGVFITLGTLATQYGWAYVGLTVTEVMASSLKVVIGSTYTNGSILYYVNMDVSCCSCFRIKFQNPKMFE
jgi:hypothetical protein